MIVNFAVTVLVLSMPYGIDSHTVGVKLWSNGNPATICCEMIFISLVW